MVKEIMEYEECILKKIFELQEFAAEIIKELQHEKLKLMRELDEKTEKIKTIENDLKSREEKVNTRCEKIEKRETELNEKLQEIEKRETELNEKLQKIEKSEAELNEKLQNIDKKEIELKIKVEKIDNEEKEISDKRSLLDDELKKLDEDMSLKSEREKALSELNEKLEQMEEKIQQCYYGRDNEGFRYLAKSKSFDQYGYSQICEEILTYELSSAVKGDPIQILSKCPKKYMYFCTSRGDIVLGRTVCCDGYYAFKSPHFSHAFVIPAFYKDEYIKNIDRIFYVKSFQNSYIRAIDGVEIPECVCIVNDESSRKFSKVEELLEALHINMHIFKNLLYSLFISVEESKPVYVRLNCDAVKISDYAIELLRFLMYCLPYEVRRNLGFVTYLKTPQHVKNANIMFVEELGSECIRNAFTFDMKCDEYPAIENYDKETDIYLTYVCSNINNTVCLNEFYEAAENHFESEGLVKSRKAPDYSRLIDNYTNVG